MNNNIEEKVYRYIRQYDLLRRGDCVLTAVSGGADSVCLLLLLDRLRAHLGIRLEAVTVNHGIRGASAAADVEYVKKLCGRYGISLHICQVSVPDFLKRYPMSEEEAARKLRYQCFAETASKIGAAAVAVAHHREDNCETVLHHLFRGSSLRGLRGMEPVKEISIPLTHLKNSWNDGERVSVRKNCCLQIIRPLLELSRQDIETWLEAQEISWQTDETNLTDDYTRNRLRHQIIPQITEQVNTQAVPHILQAAKDISEAQELVEELAWDWLSEYGYCGRCDGGKALRHMKSELPGSQLLNMDISVPIAELNQCRPIVQREILIQIGKSLTGELDFRDVGRVHLDMILDLTKKETSKRLELPAGLRVRKEYENLIFSKKCKKDNFILSDGFSATAATKDCSAVSADVFSIAVTEDCSAVLTDSFPFMSADDISAAAADSVTVTVTDGISPENYSFRIFLYNNDKKIPENNYTKWFDYARIKNGLFLRTRRTGDYFLLDGGGRKTVKSYMIDKKIPAAQRDQMPVLADGDHVLWLADGRISAAYKVTESTRQVLELVVLFKGK